MASSPVIPGTTTTTAAPMYLFFDTETNAIGRLCKPVTQTLMQLAWIVTDEQGSTIASNNRFVQGATSVGPRAPHPITPEYVNKNGCPPQDVLRDFMTDVDRVLQSGGRLVAHNIAFDVGVLEHAGAEFTDAMHDACLCTMKHANIVAHCSLKNVRGGVKQPKLVEMYTTLFDHAPTEKLHDAMADTKVLSLCFHELLRLGVLRPQPEAPRQSGGGGGGGGGEDTVSRHDCDAFVNASDVATVMGMMTRYKKYPYMVAERVLTRYSKGLGVDDSGGRGVQVVPSSTETEFATALKRAKKEGGACPDTGSLKKMERDMHAMVDGRGDITTVVASEAKRLITEKLSQSFGTTQETKAVSRMRIQNNNDKMFYLKGSRVCDMTWGFAGRVDGFKDGELVEIKTRRNGAFNRVPDYERVQVEIYMRMTNLQSAVLIENVVTGGTSEETPHTLERDDALWADISHRCETFFSQLVSLVSGAHWGAWSEGDSDERKRVWELLCV